MIKLLFFEEHNPSSSAFGSSKMSAALASREQRSFFSTTFIVPCLLPNPTQFFELLKTFLETPMAG